MANSTLRIHWLRWAIWATLIVALLVGGGKAMQARKAKQALADQAAAALRVPTVFELTLADVVTATTRTLIQTIELSGTVRAVNTAQIKAKVAGEVHGLRVREGDKVAAGQVVGQIDTTEFQARVKQANEQAQAAAAQLAIAQRAQANNQALVSQGFISATALETTTANLAAAQANHHAALAALDIAQKSLADTALRSPITGLIAARPVQNGERVGVDAKVMDVIDLSAMELEVAVPPGDAARLAVGMTGQVEVDGLAAPVRATVARISPAAQAASRSVMVYLSLQPHPGLRHGLFARGALKAGSVTGISLPASSVRNDKPQPYVQWVKPSAEGGSSQIVHQRIQVTGQGDWSPDSSTPAERYVIANLVADNSIITIGKVGFMQENTAVRLLQATGRQP